jgi:hypothetical protein
MANGALGKDPSSKGGKSRPKTHRYKGVWVDDKGYRVDGYGRRLPNQSKPYENIKPPKASVPTKQAPAPSDPYTGQPENTWQQQTQEQRDAQMEQQMSEWMRGTMDQAKPFQPGSFKEQMDASYKNTMAQFEADNADAFKRQEADFFQRAAEQGMDPNNPGYGALYKQEVTDRQDRARSQASRAALDASQGVQQQGFTQEYQKFLAPGEQFGQFAPTWGQLQKSGADWRQIQAELRNRSDIAKMQERGALQRANIQARSGGGGGSSGPSLYDQWRANQIEGGYGGPTPNYENEALVGGASGAGGAITNQLNKKQGR